jgi:acyl-CoA synthetase (AMP-forming)/AMP-acid ligase II
MTETLPEFLFHWAERTPDATFIGEPDRDRAYTYGQVAGYVARFRAALRRLGVSRGDRVAILADNGWRWAVAYLGAIAHGAIAVPLNTRHATGDLDPVLDDFTPAAILADAAYLARLSGRYRGRVIVSTDVDVTGMTAPALDGSEARPGEIGVVCYTSGTTGAPRGVMIRNESLVRNAAMFAHLFQSGPDSATAVVCPLFHNTGYNDGLAHMLLANGRVDVPRRFEPDAIARALAAPRYTFLIGVPTIYSRMMPLLEATPPPSASAPWFAYGGAPMPGGLATRLARVVSGARFVNVYGMSEATSITHYLPWRPGARDLAAIGVAVPGTRDRIAPDGELQVDSPTAMVGYWNDDAATRARFDGPWLRSGDLAVRGDDGLLRVVGRADELINRGGEKVAPLEVESAIGAHPDVMEASVVGLPDGDLGEIVGAAVVLRSGSAVDAEQLGRFLAGRIADYKLPRLVRFLPTLPRNPNGKVLRDEVRRLLTDG